MEVQVQEKDVPQNRAEVQDVITTRIALRGKQIRKVTWIFVTVQPHGRTVTKKQRNQKNGKKWLTFGRGFDIIILALRDRAKLIESH